MHRIAQVLCYRLFVTLVWGSAIPQHGRVVRWWWVMAKPRYRHAHQQERARLKPTVDAGEAYCVQPVCVMSSRWIPPGSHWDVAHDDSGTVTLGPAHRKCNRRDGAVRGNKMRGKKAKLKVVKRPANRWTL